MKIHIWSHGDPSVGISGQNATIETHGDFAYDMDADESKLVKAELAHTFGIIFAEKAYVAFDDELNPPDEDVEA
jgi:hypothetical protein